MTLRIDFHKTNTDEDTNEYRAVVIDTKGIEAAVETNLYLFYTPEEPAEECCSVGRWEEGMEDVEDLMMESSTLDACKELVRNRLLGSDEYEELEIGDLFEGKVLREGDELPEAEDENEKEEPKSLKTVFDSTGQGLMFGDNADIVDEKLEKLKTAKSKINDSIEDSKEEAKEIKRQLRFLEESLHQIEGKIKDREAEITSNNEPNRGIVALNTHSGCKWVYASKIRAYPLNSITILKCYIGGVETNLENAEKIDDEYMDKLRNQRAQNVNSVKDEEIEAEEVDGTDSTEETIEDDTLSDEELPELDDSDLPPLPGLVFEDGDEPLWDDDFKDMDEVPDLPNEEAEKPKRGRKKKNESDDSPDDTNEPVEGAA